MSVSYIRCQSNTCAGLARSSQRAVPEGCLEAWTRPAQVVDWHRTYDMDISCDDTFYPWLTLAA